MESSASFKAHLVELILVTNVVLSPACQTEQQMKKASHLTISNRV